MALTDKCDRDAQPRNAHRNVLYHPLGNGTDVRAVFADQEKPISQRHRHIHGTAHVIAPGHQRSGGQRDQKCRQRQPSMAGHSSALPDPQSQQNDENRKGECGRPNHSGAVAIGGGVAQQRAELSGQRNLNALHDQEKVAAQHRCEGAGCPAPANHHKADRQNQQFKVKPGAEV